MVKEILDTGKCFICGDENPSRLHEHHIVPREYGGTDNSENLTKLCAGCHQALHRLLDNRFFDRLRAYFATETAIEGMDIDGDEIPYTDSINRRLPESDHFTRIDNTVELPYSRICDGTYKEQMADWLFEDAEYIVEKVEGHESDIYEHMDFCRERAEKYGSDESADWRFTYKIEPKNTRIDPWILVRTAAEHVSRGNAAKHNEHYQIHCGYCHRVFNGAEQANVAHHLKIKHNITDPYWEPEPPEGTKLFEEVHGDRFR